MAKGHEVGNFNLEKGEVSTFLLCYQHKFLETCTLASINTLVRDPPENGNTSQRGVEGVGLLILIVIDIKCDMQFVLKWQPIF